MKSLIFSLLAVAFCCQSTATFAQVDTTYHNVYIYIKVAPDKTDDYLKLIKANKKIIAGKIKAGKMDSWSTMKVLSPSGASCEYNYISRLSYKGNVQLAGYFEEDFWSGDWKSLLTPAEIALVNKRYDIRTIVKTEVWSTIESAMSSDMSDANISVCNYFAHPEGKTQADHVKMEKDIWMPVHAARVKDGKMKAWLLMGLEFPFGSSMPYQEITVDVYKDMKQMFAPFFEDYMAKAHPGKSIPDLIKATNEATKLIKGEVRMRIDRLN
jgi:hypothetical protein